MATLNDYINWRGDILFSQVPINDVDCLAFSQLCYIQFDNIAETAAILGPSVELVTEDTIDKNLVFEAKRFKFAHLMNKCDRFKDLVLHDYVNLYDEELQMQFSALSIDLPNGDTVIAYRGTDDTLIGWKEDFNLAFTSPIPAQEKSVDYIENIAEKTPGNIYVCGHSKGGNLSVYAAAMCSQQVRDKIIATYSFDGPGFDSDTVKSSGYIDIASRIHSFVPKSSIVGIMLAYHDQYTVVKSGQVGIFQHDALSWEVMGKEFVKLDTRTNSSIRMDEALHQWINDMSIDARRELVNTLYEILMASEAKTLSELRESPLKSIGLMISTYSKLDTSSKKHITKMISKLLQVSTEPVLKRIENALGLENFDTPSTYS